MFFQKKRLLVCVTLVIVCFYATTRNRLDYGFCKRKHQLFRRDLQPKPTVVTAFYDIGPFIKGTIDITRTPDDYLKWMNVFSFLNNYVVFYTDSNKYAAHFQRLRKDLLNITMTVHKPRKQLWPFNITTEIRSVFLKDGYPSFYPNTVIPDYSAVQHSKYALLEDAILNGYVKTEYICWIDIGAFRDISEEKTYFHLELPPEFNNSMIGFNQLYELNPFEMKTKDIFLNNSVWVAGNAFVGYVNTMKQFCRLYKTAVAYFLSNSLANTDQQVLYAMYTSETMNKLNVDVLLQLYPPNSSVIFVPNKWFYMAYLMYKQGC